MTNSSVWFVADRPVSGGAVSGPSSSAMLAGRRVLVTGASRGIGFATARLLAAHGAEIAMVARQIDALRDAARVVGGSASIFTCDIADAAAVDALTGAIGEKWPDGPDIVVNNAGLFELALLQDTAASSFRRAVDTNLVAPFLLIRAFLPGMLERAMGHLVTIGSISDRAIFPENGAYSASKFGARALHEVLRAETRGSGVRASLISPSAVDTPLWDALDPESRPGFTPRSAMLAADAVADAVLWVASRPPEVNVDELRLGRA